MRIMESSDSSRELLDNVAMTEVSAPFMMQRIGVEPSQLLSSELLPAHGGLVVDMTNNEYLPAVSYATDDLLEHHLTEEDRNLAAALVAVQLVQQQKQQQMHQDSNVIVSTNSLASLVSSSSLENGKVELGELVISSVDKPVISSINNTYINIEERHHHLQHDSILKKYGNITVEPVENDYISIKQENDECLQQRDSDCENKNDVRTSKKSLPHKKRISRKLQKKIPLSKKGHKCSMCEQAFSSAEELNAHTNCHSDSVNIVVQPNPTTFSCQICGLICNDQLSFYQHLKLHYEPSFHSISMTNDAPTKELEANASNSKDPLFLPSLYCKECGKSFRRQKAYEAHMVNAHNKIEDEFSEPEDLMEGIRGVVEANHDDDDDTDNDVADSKGWHYSTTALQSVVSGNNLVVHQAAGTTNNQGGHVHGNVNKGDNTVCHLCGQLFHSNEEVIEHLQECKAAIETKLEQQTSDAEEQEQEGKSRVMRKKRRKNGTLFCPHCDRVFSHRNSLMYHMRGHTGERPHQCDICGKSFFAASALKVHMRLHSGDKPYKCEYCGRHFRQWGDLKYHCISIHSDEKNYQCEYCGKDFARKYSLIVHRRIHTGEKNYRCEFCGKTFRASSYLQNHRRIHTGEKPHPCEICGKPFRVRSDMKRHLNTHARRKTSGPVPRVTDNANVNTPQHTTAVLELTEGGDSSNNVVGSPIADQLLEGHEHEQEHDEQISEESDVQYQVSRDPLESVRDGPNTLFNNGHLLICYPSELQARSTMETQWVNSDS